MDQINNFDEYEVPQFTFTVYYNKTKDTCFGINKFGELFTWKP